MSYPKAAVTVEKSPRFLSIELDKITLRIEARPTYYVVQVVEAEEKEKTKEKLTQIAVDVEHAEVIKSWFLSWNKRLWKERKQ